MTSPLDRIDSCQMLEMQLDQLYPDLRALVRPLVYTHMIPVWRGQENDIIDDIVQETLIRLWTYLRQAETGQRSSIHSLSRFCYTIALNYCIDLQRKDRRNVHPPSDISYMVIYDECHVYRSVEDIAVESLCVEEWFALVAKLIATFPEKQRHAVLTDLANRMHFSKSPTSLQRAFLSVGIQLQDYQLSIVRDRQKQNRYVALVAYVYKRLSHIIDKGEKQENDMKDNFYNKTYMLLKIKLQDKKYTHRHFKEKNEMSPWDTTSSSSLQLEEENYGIYNMGAGVSSQPYQANQEKNDMAELEQGEPFKKECDVPAIREDSELAALALQLQKTQPSMVDPLFRETLRAKVLEITLQSQLDKELSKNKELKESSQSGTILKVDQSQKCFYPLNEPDISEICDNRELAALAEQLRETAPSTSIDPEFREKLRGKLLDIVFQQRPDDAAEIQAQRVTAQKSEALFDITHLISLADEITNFPDQERRALLIDLAIKFQGHPYWWHLQQAFLEVGIQLLDYQGLLPNDTEAYRWHTTSLDHAYKRIKRLLEGTNDLDLKASVRIC